MAEPFRRETGQDGGVRTGFQRRVGRIAPALAVTALSAAWAPALAAPYRAHHFVIPAETAQAALIDFAVQANISVGGSPHCSGRVPALSGLYTDEEALSRLLAPTSCTFRRVAPDVFRIIARAAPERPQAAFPERPPDETVTQVVVTATRRRAVADQLPDAVSTVSASEIREIGAVDISDLAAAMVGVTTTNLGPGRDKILLRGLSDGVFTGRTQSTVGIYLDDTPITYNAPDPDLRLTDVARVEVLRGPQGTLYGDGSIGGVYRIVTLKPAINVFSGAIDVGGAVADTGAPSHEADGVLNIPLIKDRAALRLVGYDEVAGGYIDNVALRVSNIDGSERSGGRAMLKVLIDGDWSLTVGGAYQSITSDDTQFVTPSLGRLHVANAIREASTSRFSDVFVTLEQNAPWGDFRSTTSIVQHDLDSRTDASQALPLFGAKSGFTVGAYDEPIGVQMLVEDAVATSPGVGPLQWLAGIYASSTLEDTTSTVLTGPDRTGLTQPLYDEFRRDRLAEIAPYGDVSYALTDRLTLSAGLRASWTRVTTGSDVVAPPIGRSRDFSGRASFSNLSPKLGADYALTAATHLYTLASEGARVGGFNTGGPIGTVFAASPRPGAVARRFAPDELWNFEVGVKTKLFDDRFELRAALFYDDWRRIQTDQYLPSGLSYTANAGDGRNYGAETELVARPTRHLTIEANALVNNPQLTHPGSGFTAKQAEGLPGVPDVSIGARVAYQRPVHGDWSMLLSAEDDYVGRSHVTFNPAQSPVMGGYNLDRATAQLIGPRWRVMLDVINPTDEGGDTFSEGNPFDFKQIRQSTPQRPRTYRLLLAYAF
ncbi:MAG TPA: TonB-dependent receptor [Caulobacteraceae bacterium]|jgi:outer membrane receptor protein involved in Fe transport|nr:TonB-dependent receptor [Caulobacteraceae bacterium]